MRLVRPATVEDAAALADVYRPYVLDTAVSFETEPPDAAAMAERLTSRPRLPWLVAVRNEVVVGFAYASTHRARAAYRWAVDVSVYLRDDERGQGTGRALYAELLPAVADLGHITAHAGITLPNEASVGLHEALGFERVGVYRQVGHKLRLWHDVGWWRMSLREPAERPEEPREWSSRQARASARRSTGI